MHYDFQEILEKILKPTKPIKSEVKPSVQSVNLQSKLNPKNIFKIEEPKQEPKETTYHLDDFDDDIDFSALENVENTIPIKEDIQSESRPPEPEIIQPKLSDEPRKLNVVKSNIFDNIRPNWDTNFNIEDNDDADLISTVDEVCVNENKVGEMSHLRIYCLFGFRIIT